MTGRRWFAVCLLLLAIFTATVKAEAAPIPVIIKVAPLSNVLRVVDALGGSLVDSIPGSNMYLVNVPRLPLLQPVLGLVGNTLGMLGIEWLEVNVGVPEPKHGQFGILSVRGTTLPDWYKNQPAMKLMRADQAWSYSKGRGVVVADINSQIDYAHPALRGHLTGGYDFVASRPQGSAVLNQSSASFLDQSSASFLDQSSASFIDQSSASFLDTPPPFAGNPAYSHGTLTAGVIAVVAPDSMIMPLRAFDENGAADLFILAKAIRYATNNGAQVINMSFGTLEKSKALQDSIDYARGKGVILVASAGNSNTSAPQYPAAFNGVLTTAATTLADKKASFSNYGTFVFADAPGENIISAYPGGYYGVVSGTSFSAPALAGAAAVVRSIKSSSVVANAIAAGAVDIDSKNPAYVDKLGYGRIDVLKAVRP